MSLRRTPISRRRVADPQCGRCVNFAVPAIRFIDLHQIICGLGTFADQGRRKAVSVFDWRGTSQILKA
jgi:Fe-S-cluster formation regulator IscX/YfhJ